MSALFLALLLDLAPPPLDGGEAPQEVAPPTKPEPPPPSLVFPPQGTTPPDETGEVVPDQPDDSEAEAEPEPDDDEFSIEPPGTDPPLPPEWTVDERTLEGLPYAPTAARESAVRRGNDVLLRPFRKPVYSVAAAARLGVLVGGGQKVIQPIAWGLAMQVRLHFLRVVKSRFGIEIYAGHTRWQQRNDFEVVVGNAPTVTRINALTHTDVSLGPSFEIPIGPVFVQFGASGGFAVSTLGRARSADPTEDERINEFDGLLRGGLSLGVPVANRQGFVLGTAVQQVFSNREVLVNPNGTPDSAKAKPFSTWLESYLAYQVWF